MLMKKPSEPRIVTLLMLILVAGVSCQRSRTPVSASVLNVPLCELYKNPTNYEGKRITVSATITQLPRGRYLYPSFSCENGYSFIKLEGETIESGGLRELESSSASSGARKEFDAEITGIFDSKYAEDFEAFRFRIVPSEIKQKSPVKSGRPLAAG
jgi:hypothetical protein